MSAEQELLQGCGRTRLPLHAEWIHDLVTHGVQIVKSGWPGHVFRLSEAASVWRQPMAAVIGLTLKHQAATPLFRSQPNQTTIYTSALTLLERNQRLHLQYVVHEGINTALYPQLR